MLSKPFLTDLAKKNEALFTGLLCGVLLSASVLFVSFFSWSSNPPSPAPTKTAQNHQDSRSAEPPKPETEQRPSTHDGATLFQNDAAPANAQKGGEGGIWSRFFNYPIWSPGNAILTLLATVVIAFAAFRQWLNARAQTRAMYRQSRYMEKQSDLMDESLMVGKVAADAAKKSADIAIETVEQMRLEQRAWIGFIKAKMYGINVGNHIGADMMVENTGLTPGFVDRQRTELLINSIDYLGYPEDYRKLVEDVLAAPAEMEIVLAPGAKRTFKKPHFGQESLSQELWTEIRNGKKIVYLLSVIVYRDVFGRERVSTCSYVYNGFDGSLWKGNRFNRMD